MPGWRALRECGDTVLEYLMPLLRRAAEASTSTEWGVVTGLDAQFTLTSKTEKTGRASSGVGRCEIRDLSCSISSIRETFSASPSAFLDYPIRIFLPLLP